HPAGGIESSEDRMHALLAQHFSSAERVVACSDAGHGLSAAREGLTQNFRSEERVTVMRDNRASSVRISDKLPIVPCLSASSNGANQVVSTICMWASQVAQ